ncbi:MAG: DUF2017 family protein [Actinomycetales bacterium]
MFRRTRAGIESHFGPAEADLLSYLLDELDGMLTKEQGQEHAQDRHQGADEPSWVRELGLDESLLAGLGADDPAPVRIPQDPAMARLLPDGSADEAQAADFRRFTESEVRAAKRRQIAVVRRMLARSPKPVLSGEEAQALTRVLTDLRLVIATRLGIEDEVDAGQVEEYVIRGERDHDAQYHWMAHVYDHLGYLQEVLTGVLLEGLDNAGDGRRQPPA